MQFAEASQHRLVRQRIVLGDERGILGGHLVQDVGDSLLVPAALRGNGEAVHRHRKLERAHVNLIFVVRIVQHAIEHDIVDLGDGRQVTGSCLIDFDVFSPLQHEKGRDFE